MEKEQKKLLYKLLTRTLKGLCYSLILCLFYIVHPLLAVFAIGFDISLEQQKIKN